MCPWMYWDVVCLQKTSQEQNSVTDHCYCNQFAFLVSFASSV